MMIRNSIIFTLCLIFSAVTVFAGTGEDVSNMKAATWYTINGSAFRDSDVYIGPTGNSSIFSYSGGAFDIKRNQLMVFGGGHGDANDNGIYAFDMNTYTWVEVAKASSSAHRSEGFDCIYDTSGGYLEDGKPIANHTAQLIAYHPGWDALIQPVQGAPSNTADCYKNFDNSNWNRYMLGTSKWDTSSLTDFPIDSYYGVVLVDSSSNVWFFHTQSDPNDKVWEFKYSDSTWYARNNESVPYGPGIVGAMDTKNDIAVIFGNNYFAAWDVSTDTSISLLSSTSSGATDMVALNYSDLAYDPVTGLFVGWGGVEGESEKVYALKVDPDNSLYHWYEVQPASGNTVDPGVRVQSRGPHGRWAYVPKDNAFILAKEFDQDVLIYKLTESTTDTDPPEVSFDVPATSNSNTVPVLTLSAKDATSAILGYQITTTSTPPKAWTDDWVAAPNTYDLPSAGKWDLYAWAMDAYGNVSPYAKDTVEVNGDKTVVQPANQEPMAIISATPTIGEAPLTVSFDGGGSSDADGSISSYDWNFGDGAVGSGMSVDHTYTNTGQFTAVLTVTDDAGSTVSASVMITNQTNQTDPTDPTDSTDSTDSDPVDTGAVTGATTDNDFPEVKFDVPATSASTTVAISSLTASDLTSAIVGYQITTTPIPPKPLSDNWGAAPSTYEVPTAGRWDLYAWAMDASGNVSRYAVDTVEVNCTHIYVDADCPDSTTYDPNTESCTGGSARVYDTITDAVAYVNANNSNSSSHIIEIDSDDSWTGSSSKETDPNGPCYGLPDDHSNIPIEFNHDGWATIKGKDDTAATIQWLCHSADNYDHCWGPGAVQHHSIITMDNSKDTVPNLRVEYLKLTGASIGGAGIWIEPDCGDLVVKHCEIYENDNGILTSESRGTDLTILHNKFYNNGTYIGTGGQHHNLYIGESGTLYFLHNYSADAYRGQLLKSRAEVNWVLYNRLTDESNLGLCATKDYCSNYPLDLPFGGESYVIGNIIQLGKKCYSDTIVNYGREVYYTFEFDSAFDAGGRPYRGTDFTIGSSNKYDMTYIYDVSGDFKAGTGRGKIDVRLYFDPDANGWRSMREAIDPDTLFTDGVVISWDNGASHATSTGPYSDKWSWPSGEHYNDMYFYFNTVINECDEQGDGAGSHWYNQYLLRAHFDTNDCDVANNAIISRHAHADELLWYAQTQNLEKKYETDSNYLMAQTEGDPGFTSIGSYNFSLTEDAGALINQGVKPGLVNGYQVIPQWQYSYPAGKTARNLYNGIDIGAYEFIDSILPAPKNFKALD